MSICHTLQTIHSFLFLFECLFLLFISCILQWWKAQFTSFHWTCSRNHILKMWDGSLRWSWIREFREICFHHFFVESSCSALKGHCIGLKIARWDNIIIINENWRKYLKEDEIFVKIKYEWKNWLIVWLKCTVPMMKGKIGDKPIDYWYFHKIYFI